MELISTLSVKNFPGVKDGKYNFSQDTIIEGDWGSGKTSILKSITWLLTGKDLQGKTIPNITDNTSVSSVGSIKLTRKKSGLNGDLNRILRGNVDEILSRIIPGYIFSGGVTNKSAAEMISGIKIDQQKDSYGHTINYYSDNIKIGKNKQGALYTISNIVVNCINHFKRGMGVDLRVNVIDILDLINLYFNLDKLIEQINKIQINKRKGIVKLKNIIDLLTKEISKLKNENNNNSNGLIKIYELLLSGLNRIDNNDKPDEYIYTHLNNYIDSYLIYIYRNIKASLNDIIRNVNSVYSSVKIDYKNLELYYERLLEDVTLVTKDIESKQLLLDNVYLIINNKLSESGIVLNRNNTLEVYAEIDGVKKSLLELPRHIRFLLEINLCSRIQLNYIRGNIQGGEDYAGLILIDDYNLQDDEDSIDELLSSALSHQVILTKYKKGAKEPIINID